MASLTVMRLLAGLCALLVSAGALHSGPGGHHGGHAPPHPPTPSKRCRLLPPSQQPHVPARGAGSVTAVVPATTCNTR
jgi:hypothetical protein